MTKSIRASFPPIPERTYFPIGLASELCGTSQSKLRDLEEKLGGLLKVHRMNNRRYYTQDNIKLVREVRVLTEENGFTLEGVIKQFKDGSKPQSVQTTLLLGEIQTLLKELRSLKHEFRMETS